MGFVIALLLWVLWCFRGLVVKQMIFVIVMVLLLLQFLKLVGVTFSCCLLIYGLIDFGGLNWFPGLSVVLRFLCFSCFFVNGCCCVAF